MKKLLKLVFWAALLSAVLVGTSYVGARARVAIFLGSPLPPLGTRVISFDLDGVPEFAGQPRAWAFSYGPGQIPGTPHFRIFVSPTGRLIGTLPRDLQTRLTTYKAQRLEP